MHEEQNVDAAPTEDARILNQRLITDGVDLVFALREAEETLAQLAREDTAHMHSIPYILQQAKVDEIKNALNEVVVKLNALPHTPVHIEPDLGPLRAWMEAHREKFEQFKRFCDEYRAPSPMEEGEVHPEVDKVLSAVGALEQRLEELKLRRDRVFAHLEPIVNPRRYEFQQQVKRLKDLDRQRSELFSMFMSRVDFTELSEQEQRVAIEQHVLQVARETFEGMLKIEPSKEIVEGMFWLCPLGVNTRGMVAEKAIEEPEEDEGMDIDFFFDGSECDMS